MTSCSICQTNAQIQPCWQKCCGMCAGFITAHNIFKVFFDKAVSARTYLWKLGLKVWWMCSGITEDRVFFKRVFCWKSRHSPFKWLPSRLCVCAIFSLPLAGRCLTLYPLKSLNLSLEGVLPSSPHTVSYLPPLSWPLIHPSGLYQVPRSAICCPLVLIRDTRFWLAHLAG